MSKKQEQEIREYLKVYFPKLKDELNFRLLCDAKTDVCHTGILWIEDIVVTEVVFCKDKKKTLLKTLLSKIKRIKQAFIKQMTSNQEKRKGRE